MAGVRGLPTARQATVKLSDRAGTPRGQGLLMDLGAFGTVVLTCHHVIAPVAQGDLCVRIPGEQGKLGSPLDAAYDAEHSRPEQDAVVLKVGSDGQQLKRTNPLLHCLDPAYNGDLKVRVLTHRQPNIFSADLGPASPLDIAAPKASAWPHSPERYVIPAAFQLEDSGESAEGISGGVVLCEDGVLGLLHFARPESADYKRAAFVVPLSVWARDWPDLDRLIEPLVDGALRNAATVGLVRNLSVGMATRDGTRDPELVIAGYQEELYVERPEISRARDTLERRSGLLLVGRPMSGKTRLAWELVRDRSDAVLVLPHHAEPPGHFETAGIAGREIIVLCDDLHSRAEQLEPMRWRERLQQAPSTVRLIATCRDGQEWKRVRDSQERLLNWLEQDDRVFLSKVGEYGEDLPDDLAAEIGRKLKLSKHELSDRFDGTPGSLTLDLHAMSVRYKRLTEELIVDTVASVLLDSLKLLHIGGQAAFSESLARLVAETIRGDRPVAKQTWETLCRRTRDEGFGHFAESGFRTYPPYLENCVSYDPTHDLGQLCELLKNTARWSRLISFASERFAQGDVDRAQTAFRYAIDSGSDYYAADAAINLGKLLAQKQDYDGARTAFQQAVESRNVNQASRAAVHLGMLDAAHGHQADARASFQRAIDSGSAAQAPRAAVQLGMLLASQDDVAGARTAFQHAIDSGSDYYAADAAINLGKLLAQKQDYDGARTAFQQAVESRNVNQASRAAVHLGMLDAAHGHQADARASFQRAIDSGSAAQAPRAAVQLGMLLASQDDVAGARTAFQHAIDSGSDYYAADAAINLGKLLAQKQDYDGARTAFQHAIGSRRPGVVATAEAELQNLACQALVENEG